jgi:hypothetical protein
MKLNPLNLSQSFADKIKNITGSTKYNLYRFAFSVMMKDNTVLELQSLHIDRFTIHQDFGNNFADIILLEMTLPRSEYMLLLKNRHNLRVKVAIHYMNTDNEVLEPLAIFTYMGAIHIHEDPALKGFGSDNNLVQEVDGGGSSFVKLKMELVDPDVYRVRKTKFNFILNNATMEETIMFIAKLMGFRDIYMVPPDNREVYLNVVVPPLMEAADIFNFLQESPAYGVYNTGISHYIRNGILYVFPLYSNNSHGNKVTFYNAGEGAFAGSNNYHRVSDDGLEVVLSGKTTVVNNSQSFVENVGNWFIVNQPKLHLGSSGIISGDKFQVNNALLTNVYLKSDEIGMSDNAFTQTYMLADNIHSIYTSLNAANISVASGTWPHAVPFTITPVSNISYIYDSDKRINQLKGWCSKITYTFSKGNTVQSGAFQCVATVVLGLAKDQS